MQKFICDECQEVIPQKNIYKALFTKELTLSCPNCIAKFKVKERSVWITGFMLLLVSSLSGSILNHILNVDFITYLIAMPLIFVFMVICSTFFVYFKKIS
ncbi:TIGR04104 family putative zinc finger protein [Bacillus sp. OAE603]|uniref:TIGR04104 family putative zinc finger protein n=1 Tax=Gottfriedia sp. OAE603 TaxID=2663872 RepID=UPI001789DD82